MATSSTAALLISCLAMSTYAYSAYYMLTQLHKGSELNMFPKSLEKFGNWAFLTFHTLLIQVVTYLLHIGAHFYKPLENVRDMVFTIFAFPLSCVVFYVFWGVWHIWGREMILPPQLDAVIPGWLNHNIHTIIVPMNIILSILVRHKYFKYGILIFNLYMGIYFVWLHYIRSQTGIYIYIFLEKFDNKSRIIYFIVMFLFSNLTYKLGKWLTKIVHGDEKKVSIARARKQI